MQIFSSTFCLPILNYIFRTFGEFGETIPNATHEIECKKIKNNSLSSTSTGFISVYKTLSCFALMYQIAIIVNVLDIQPCDQQKDFNCPDDSEYHFNTNVVFNQTGHFIAK